MQVVKPLPILFGTLLLSGILSSTTWGLGLHSTMSSAPYSSTPYSMPGSRVNAGTSKVLKLRQSRSRFPSLLLSSIETNDEEKDPNTLISAQDDRTQQLSFALICSGVLAGSVVFLNFYNYLEVVLPPSIFAPFYTVLPYVLSSAFIAAGIAHFAIEDTFTSFVPPKGSWGGLWQVPSPGSDSLGLTYEQFHSFWSGIAEVIVGSWLIIATATANGVIEFGDSASDIAVSSSTIGITTIPAALMWILTAAVTPANIYMYTHNPVVPRIPALPYPWGHGARGLLQCALLGVFCKLTIHSIS